MCVGFHRTPFFSLARHSCSCFLPLSFASAAFVVSFIIPLICCAPARDHHNLSRMYFFAWSSTQFMCVCLCLCISYVCLFPPWNVRFKCLLLILSFLLVFSQSCCLFPHTQRFLRAALIFAAARGHYQLIDYFDCYLIPLLGRARRICASVVSRSLSLVHSEALSLLCAVAGLQT